MAVAPSAEATDCSSPWEEAFIDCMKTVYSYYKASPIIYLSRPRVYPA